MLRPEKERFGRFLDIGANHPTEISNTWALENQLGWKGFLVDNDAYCCGLCRTHRLNSVVIEDDATKYDYSRLVDKHFTYLSLDVDSATLATLKKLLADGITFTLATIEHDSYRFGTAARDEMRAILTNAGYKLAHADVCNPESPTMPYEDWWYDPLRV
jgi:hypothetical protein